MALLEREFWHYGPQVERFLREHDPDRPSVERHFADGPWYRVTLGHRVLVRERR